jgi:hypothetical protein
MRAFGDNAHAALAKDRIDAILALKYLTYGHAVGWLSTLTHATEIVAWPDPSLKPLNRVGFCSRRQCWI